MLNLESVSKLEIIFKEFGHQAISDCPEQEIARILRQLADKVESEGLLSIDVTPLRDSNGNIVGTVDLWSE